MRSLAGPTATVQASSANMRSLYAVTQPRTVMPQCHAHIKQHNGSQTKFSSSLPLCIKQLDMIDFKLHRTQHDYMTHSNYYSLLLLHIPQGYPPSQVTTHHFHAQNGTVYAECMGFAGAAAEWFVSAVTV